MPGIGLYSVLLIVSEIGDIHRFPQGSPYVFLRPTHTLRAHLRRKDPLKLPDEARLLVAPLIAHVSL